MGVDKMALHTNYNSCLSIYIQEENRHCHSARVNEWMTACEAKNNGDMEVGWS